MSCECPVHCVAQRACLCVYVLIDGAENFANGVSLRLGYQMHKGLDPQKHAHTASSTEADCRPSEKRMELEYGGK